MRDFYNRASAQAGRLSRTVGRAQASPMLGSPGYGAWADAQRAIAWRWVRRYGVRAVVRRTIYGMITLAAIDAIKWYWPWGMGYRVVCASLPGTPGACPGQGGFIIWYPGGGACNTALCNTTPSITSGSASDPGTAASCRFFGWRLQLVCGVGQRMLIATQWSRTQGYDRGRVVPLAPVVPIPRARGAPAPALSNPREAARWTPRPFVPPRTAVREVPTLRPLPLSAQTRISGNHPEALDGWKGRPWAMRPHIRTITIDSSGTVTNHTRVLSRPVARAAVAAVSPQKEIKVRPTGRAAALYRSAALFSEAYDFIDVLYRALPKVRGERNGTTYEKARALSRRWRELDWSLVAQWYAANELQDAVIGQRYRMSRDVSFAIDPSGQLYRGIATAGGSQH